jgi:hypothetical protein
MGREHFGPGVLESSFNIAKLWNIQITFDL